MARFPVIIVEMEGRVDAGEGTDSIGSRREQ